MRMLTCLVAFAAASSANCVCQAGFEPAESTPGVVAAVLRPLADVDLSNRQIVRIRELETQASAEVNRIESDARADKLAKSRRRGIVLLELKRVIDEQIMTPVQRDRLAAIAKRRLAAARSYLEERAAKAKIVAEEKARQAEIDEAEKTLARERVALTRDRQQLEREREALAKERDRLVAVRLAIRKQQLALNQALKELAKKQEAANQPPKRRRPTTTKKPEKPPVQSPEDDASRDAPR